MRLPYSRNDGPNTLLDTYVFAAFKSTLTPIACAQSNGACTRGRHKDRQQCIDLFAARGDNGARSRGHQEGGQQYMDVFAARGGSTRAGSPHRDGATAPRRQERGEGGR